MPTYEYKCDACGNEFEKFQPITSSPVKKCPKCGKNKVRRLISAGAGLIFKGSGFYITDYRDNGYNESKKADNAAGSEKPADTKPSEGGGDSAKPASTESKPAETKTEKPTAAKESTPKSEPKSEPKASKSAKKR